MCNEGQLQPYTASRIKAKFATYQDGSAPVPGDAVEEWEYTKGLIKQCQEADVIVFSVPMWNLSIPYSLKRWMDHIAQPHKTFDPTTYKGLLGKRGFVVAASGGGMLGGPMDYVTPYMKQFCNFVGIEPVLHTYVNGSVGENKQANVQAAMQSMKAQARLASTEMANGTPLSFLGAETADNANA
jgi:FMN-dependent NADH-azoreductase